MEGLNPPLKCLIEIHSALSNGETVRVGLSRYLSIVPLHDEFASSIRRFLFAWDQGQDWRVVVNAIKSAYRRALLELCATALAGQPILPHLEELRQELMSAANAEIGEHLELLPIKMLVPLLLFQFPAFLLLLFGPLLVRLLEEMNR
jgi:hypothetical protein